MRRTFLLTLISLFASQTQAATPDTFRELTERRAAAYVAEDRAYYEKLLSKDFVLLGDNGSVTNKADYLDSEFGSPRPKNMKPFYSFNSFHVVTARSDMAIVSYIKTQGMKVGEQTVSADARRLDTYVLENGEWRLVAMAAIPVVKPPKAISLPPKKLTEYVGKYSISEGLESVVTVAGDHLTEQTTGQPAVTLLPVAPDTFFDPDDSPTTRMVFRRDSRGKIIAWVYTSGDQEIVGKRMR